MAGTLAAAVGLLDRLRQKFSQVDDGALAAEVEALRERRRQFNREHQNTKAQAHQILDKQLDDRIAYAEARVSRVDARGVNPTALEELLATWAARDPDFRKLVHGAIDAAAPDLWSPLAPAEIAKELGRLDEEIADRERELRRREAQRAKDEAEQRLADVEAQA